MGINNQQSNSSAINLGYSAFLGMMYVSTPESEAAVEAAKAHVGNDEVKKGYTGKSGATAKAREFLKGKGVDPVSITGKLVHANLRLTEKDGRKFAYANVCVKDSDGLYCVSIPAGHESAQLLTRKLANAKIGEETTIGVFATMEKSENPAYADRSFAKHIAMVKQGGEEVVGVSPAPIAPMVDEAIAKLKASGMDDPEVISATRKKMAANFHYALWQDIEGKVAAYKASRGEDVPAASSPMPASGVGPEMDFDDSVPF